MDLRLRALLAAALLLAGCAAPAPAEPPADADDIAAPQPMRVEGLVQTTSFEPIPGAIARVGNHTATSSSDGTFVLELDPAFYILNITASGYLPFVQTLTPEQGTVAVDAQLVPIPDTPYHETVHFQGYMQCAAEYVIISGSCDAVITSGQTLGADPVFTSDNSLELDVGTGWKTMVGDLVFESPPTTDGLRVVVQGIRDESEVLTYEQYARFYGQETFNFRLEPGSSYEEGERDVPANQTAFRFEVYPHSHGWHSTCEAMCLLGAGGGVDIQFDLYVTTFYVDPAPAGWTL